MGRRLDVHTSRKDKRVEREVEVSSVYIPSDVQQDEMNWDAYAVHYDLMCELNPSYQQNIEVLLDHLAKWNLPANASICDIGAGTGNYIEAISKKLPDAHFTHIDFDNKMNHLALQKYERARIKSVDFISDFAQRVELPPKKFDLIICINALYAISPQRQVLHKIHSWLKDDGRFFIIDFGRKQRTLAWVIYLFRESMKRHRVGTYAKALVEGREVLKQNRRSTKGQESGRYWLHSTSEFGNTLVDCGFTVDEINPCYRGYADLAVCRRGTS